MEQACRELKELHPLLQEMVKELKNRCEKEGIKLGISETYRTRNRQDDLFAQGRTRPGKIVTYASGSSRSSYHQWRLAFDVFVNEKGKEYDEKLLARIGALGQSIGLEWGGAWKSFVDRCHFQYTGGLSIEDLKQGRTIDEHSKYQIEGVTLWIEEECLAVSSIKVAGHHYVKLQDLRGRYLDVSYHAQKKCPFLKIKP